jgi:hypothetical protein
MKGEPMEQNFVFTLFDLSGVIEMETINHRYTYYLDGAIVGKAKKCANFSPGRALNYIKKHAYDVQKEKRDMVQTTAASKHVRREQAVCHATDYMQKHGNFTLFRNSKSLRVFPAPCDCPGNRISGVLFFKWVKLTPKSKTFRRLIMHVVCYKCMAKSPIMVIDPINWDPKIKGFEPHPFLKQHNLKHYYFKVK